MGRLTFRRLTLGLAGPAGMFVVLLVLGTLALAGCRYPNDIEHSLESIQGGTLNVGVAENPPWIIRSESGARGLEAEIIQQLADQLNADIQWHWHTESQLLQALHQGQLDLVASGLTQASQPSKFAAATRPYYRSRYTVGASRQDELPDSLEGMSVAVPPVNHLHQAIRDAGARPERTTALEAQDLVAAPTWWLAAHGFEAGPWELATANHVLALPKGENAWMLTVQRHLNSYSDIEQRLRQWEGNP